MNSYPLAFLIAVCQYIDMICVSCQDPATQVTNSRPHKKDARVWRRRHCAQCNTDFTTQEKPVTDGTAYVINSRSGQREPFYQGKLIWSIAKSFAHDEHAGIIHALPLSETVLTALLAHSTQSFTTTTIRETCYSVLLRFDQSAAAQYALAHNIINPPKRRRKRA